MNRRILFPAVACLLFVTGCSLLPDPMGVYPRGGAGKSPEVEITITGHVENEGRYRVSRTLREPLSELIRRAGGFSPEPEFETEKTSTVAWIERTHRGDNWQLIILDYLNKQIFSERTINNNIVRLERYHWEDFEFLEGDTLFVTTSRKSLEIDGYSMRWVEPKGWHIIDRLRLFGMTTEETLQFEQARRLAQDTELYCRTMRHEEPFRRFHRTDLARFDGNAGECTACNSGIIKCGLAHACSRH